MNVPAAYLRRLVTDLPASDSSAICPKKTGSYRTLPGVRLKMHFSSIPGASDDEGFEEEVSAFNALGSVRR